MVVLEGSRFLFCEVARMNGKRLFILGIFAFVASAALPAFAGVTSNQVNITVKWNTQAVGSLVLATNYSATGAQQLTAPAILQNQNGGVGTCTANGVGSEAAGTANFGNVSADNTKFTNCQYKNGFVATIATSDPGGFILGYAATAGFPAGYGLCAIHNGTWATDMPVTQSSAGAATSITAAPACSTGDRMDVTGTATAFNSGSPTNGTNLGADIDLVIPNNASIVNASVTEQFTLTLN
jgi:hypothetical protein